MSLSNFALTLLAGALLSACSSQPSGTDTPTNHAAQSCEGKSSLRMVDYFLPMPLGNQSSDVWGAPGVLPRDIDNGLESTKRP